MTGYNCELRAPDGTIIATGMVGNYTIEQQTHQRRDAFGGSLHELVGSSFVRINLRNMQAVPGQSIKNASNMYDVWIYIDKNYHMRTGNLRVESRFTSDGKNYDMKLAGSCNVTTKNGLERAVGRVNKV